MRLTRGQQWLGMGVALVAGILIGQAWSHSVVLGVAAAALVIISYTVFFMRMTRRGKR